MIEKIQKFITQQQQQESSIVVMSDFIVDRIMKLKSKKELFDIVNNKSKYGAGAVQGIQTYETKGGKAVNLAYCLTNLGVKVTLFTIADKVGKAILHNYFSHFGDLVDLRIINGKQGYNTAFEFTDEIDKIYLADLETMINLDLK